MKQRILQKTHDIQTIEKKIEDDDEQPYNYKECRSEIIMQRKHTNHTHVGRREQTQPPRNGQTGKNNNCTSLPGNHM